MRADGEKRCVEAPHRHRLNDVHYLDVEVEGHAEIENARDLRIQHVPRQPIFRNTEAHHPTGDRPRLEDFHRMSQAAQVVGSRQARGPGADDEHAFAAFSLGWCELPSLLNRLVAEKALDRIDADRLIDLGAIAGRFTRMIADSPHNGRQRIVLCEDAPRGFVIARFGMGQPALNVLARRAGVIARRQQIHIERAFPDGCIGLVRYGPRLRSQFWSLS
jgi:hypothetical protein